MKIKNKNINYITNLTIMIKHQFKAPFILAILLFCLQNNAYTQISISNFSPQSGLTNSLITINGSGFNPNATGNVVYFGATKAIVTSATSSNITVTVPTGATYQSITVVNLATGLTAFSNKAFLPTPNCNENISTNTFLPSSTVNVGIQPEGTCSSDLDGDGKIDLVITNNGSGNISVLRNQGLSNIQFAQKVDFTVGSFPKDVVSADLNADGLPDLIVNNFSSNSISFLKNISTPGNILFDAKIDSITPLGPYKITADDIDNDGKIDILVANINSSNNISIFRNISTNGNIAFAPKMNFQFGLINCRDIATANLDFDNKPELIATFTSSKVVSVIKNTSTPGNLSFASKIDYSTVENPESIAIADFDNDDLLDLAVTTFEVLTPANQNPKSTVSIYKNSSTSSTLAFNNRIEYATIHPTWDVKIAEINGDNKPDIIVSSGNNSFKFSVFQNISSINGIAFDSRKDFFVGGISKTITIGDYDGDSRQDIATPTNASPSGKINIFRNKIGSIAVNAGNDTSICQNSQLALNANIVGTYNQVNWSDNGVGGIFLPNANTLNATWTPPVNYFGAPVTISLTAIGSFCENNTDYKIVTVKIPPFNASIEASSVSDFCSTTKLIAQPANNKYLWNTGDTSQVIYLNPLSNINNYKVIVIDTFGCTSINDASYNYIPENLLASYILIGLKSITIGENNKVVDGSVGVLGINNKVTIKNNSTINAPNTFVKAANIIIQGNANLNNQIYSPTNVPLPSMQFNSSNVHNLPNLNVQNNATGIVEINSNYKNLTIGKNAVVNVNGTVYGKIHIKEGAIVFFTQSLIDIQELKVDDGKSSNVTNVNFLSNAIIRINEKLQIGKYNSIYGFNTTIYLGKLNSSNINAEIEGEGTYFSCNIYAPSGNLNVSKATQSNPCVMTGKYICNEIESNQFVFWNASLCNNSFENSINNYNVFSNKSSNIYAEKNLLKVNELVFPNPFNNEIKINLESSEETNTTIQIFNSVGTIVHRTSKKINVGKNILTISHLQNLPKGIYFIVFKNPEKSYKTKLIKL